MKRYYLILFLIIGLQLQAQTYDFLFQRDLNVPVWQYGHPLSNPWAGGLNSVRFSQIDLNGDGHKDLFLFEKNGNRIVPFLFTDSGCRYAPEYISAFPKLHDWAMLVDFNHDGKEDIFTYGTAGIMVYKNVSDKKLNFELVTDQLQGYYYNGYTNIYASPDDYMALEDIDGDGDMDILNFWLLGKFVHYLRNYAVENGNKQDFDFKLEDECWGKFAEGESNNAITLNVSCDEKSGDEPTRHVGSSIYARDFSGHGVMDIVVGDVDFANLIWLKNGGTKEKALMTEMDTMFPNSKMPVAIYSMPAVSFLDVNGDGVDELLVSPSDPSLTKSQNKHSVWMYVLDSLTGEYQLETKAFLQEEMLDVGGGAYPVLYDWNGDGLEDLFIANYGTLDSAWFDHGYLQTHFSSSIAYYQNVGDKCNPRFDLVTDDFGDLRRMGYQALYPAFGDFTGNGHIDLLCGQRDGTLLLLSVSDSASLPHFSLVQNQYQQIDVGDFSTPQFFDLDGDGLKDLLIGNRRGHIAYYKNVSGNNTPQFTGITDTLGGVDVRDYENSYFGFAVPHFVRTADQQIKLFCGSEQGKIYEYDIVDGNISGKFLLVNQLYEKMEQHLQCIDEGIRVAPCVADLNHDGQMDMLVGNYAGGLSYFAGIDPQVAGIANQQHEFSSWTLCPMPASEKVVVCDKNVVCDRMAIYNMQGVCVNTQSCTDKHFNVSALPSGFYVVMFFNQGKRVGVSKLIKE